ncbi:MAG: hypothetical protein CRN43_03745 [Candidatus Nephrothrix sp. EaCA]|nr:MAG: hypothetical protein CRN43_03745 [Candidatus Nephrothrix sp. EaCA]
MWQAAVLMGVAGSLHCVAMCAPLAALAGKRHIFYRLLYHAGKAFTYILLGVILGFLGDIFQLKKIQNLLSVAAGAGIAAFAFFPYMLEFQHPTLRKALSRLRAAIGKNIRSPALWASFSFGFLNGFLPCGLLYAALVAAAVQPAMTDTALFMLFFAAGTCPAMLLATYSLSWAKEKFSLFHRLKIILLLGVGLLLMARGIYAGFQQAARQHDIPWCP